MAEENDTNDEGRKEHRHRGAMEKLGGTLKSSAIDQTADALIAPRIKQRVADFKLEDPERYDQLVMVYQDSFLKNGVRIVSAVLSDLAGRTRHLLPGTWGEPELEELVEYGPKLVEAAVMEAIPDDYVPSPNVQKPNIFEAAHLLLRVLFYRKKDDPDLEVNIPGFPKPGSTAKFVKNNLFITFANFSEKYPDLAIKLLKNLELIPTRYWNGIYGEIDKIENLEDLIPLAKMDGKQFKRMVDTLHPRLTLPGQGYVETAAELVAKGVKRTFAPSVPDKDKPATLRPWQQALADVKAERKGKKKRNGKKSK